MAAAKSSRLKALAKTPSSGYGYGYTSPYATPGTGLSLPRSTVKAPRAESVCSAVTSPERTPQNRGRQVSQSQPNSRSASPSSRWSYATYGGGGQGGGTEGQRRTTSRSRIPMATSRDPSPSRSIGSQSSSSVLSDSQRRRKSSLSRYGPREITIVPSGPTAAEKLLRNSREAEERMAEALGSTVVRSPLSAYGRQLPFGPLHREDSDASSIASDRSFRHEDVPEILANLASVHWSDRKEGLAGLLCLLRNQSHALSDPDLQKVTQTLTKMFMDPHTKVFSLFLETLNELITVHSGDLHRIGFLSVLLTKLFIKSGQDLLGSVAAKIGRTMDLIRASFPRHDQFTVITRFLNDPAHSSSSAKVKLNVLNYLEALTTLMDSSELPAHDPNLRDTLLKITAWAGDSRHFELQQRARHVIVCLYRVKTPYFSTVISQMAPEFQRTALDVIQNQLKQVGSAANNHATSPKPFTGIDGSTYSPLSPQTGPRSRLGSAQQSPSPQRLFEEENTENFRANPATQLKLMQALYREQSQQSGAGSSGGAKSIDDDTNSYETRLSQESSSSPKLITPQQSIELENVSVASGLTASAAKSSASERLAHCVQLLSSPMNTAEQKRSALAELHILIKEPSLWEAETQFRAVWRALLANLVDENGQEGVRGPALRGLTELIRRRPQHAQSVQLAQSALEAIIRHNDRDKAVVRLADDAITALVTSVEPAMMAQASAACVASSLAGRISGSDAGCSQAWMICAAIKVVTRLAEILDTASLKPQLAVLGPELIRAYNHTESSVRKAAVFALVGLHQRVGADAMHPYVSHLPGCKLRLLNLYIERTAQQTNGQSRVESSPSPSSCSNASNL